MKFSRTLIYSFLAVAVLASWALLSGCAPMSAGPTQPLLPQLTAEDKFSDRFELEEEPQFFYDLFQLECIMGTRLLHPFSTRRTITPMNTDYSATF